MMRLRRLILPGFLAAALYWAVFGGEYSVFELAHLRSSLVEEEARLAEVTGEIGELTAWRDSLAHDPGTIERVAREEFGMVGENEVLYRFVDPNGSGGASTPER